MATYIGRRLFAMLITLLATSFIIFVLSEVVPVDPAHAILGQYTTPADVQALRVKMELDHPVLERYIKWLGRFVRGDLGSSYQLAVEIKPVLLNRFRNTAILAISGMVLLVPLSLLLGIIAGLSEGRWPDWIISTWALITTSVPEFVTGVLLLMIFAWWLKWLPPNSQLPAEGQAPLPGLPQLVLPAATIALTQFGYLARITRISIVKVNKSAYVRTAVLKGLPRRTIVFRHILRNALLAPITVITTQLGWMMGGLVVIESIFAYPGLGRLFANAAVSNDIPMLEASAMVGIIIAVSSQLAADLLYGFLNPLIRHSQV